jgi:transposase-like protein
LIEKYLSKGIPQHSFCQEEGIKKGTFSYWLRKYKSSSEEGPEKESGFISLQPLGTPVVDGEISLRIGRVELNLRGSQNLESLIPLIKALA